MAKNNPFEKVAQEIAELLAVLKNTEGRDIKKTVPKWVEEALKQLEKNVQAFQEITDQMLKETVPVGPATKIEELPPQDKKVWDRLEKLKQEIELKKRGIEFMLKKKPTQPKDKKSAARDRKNKFGRLGGKKDWKPM